MAKLQPSDIVRKGNELMESKYRLGLMEQKLILTVAAKISKNDSYDKTYIIGIKEFCDLIGLKGNSAYSELRKLTLKLRGNAFEVRIGDQIIQTTWLTKVVYKEREGYMELGIDEELKEFFFELKKNFTSYELQNVVRLKRSFSIRMYELLKRYSFRSEKVFEVNELKEILGVEDTYTLYADFKRRAILDTQKELRAKTDIDFTFEEIKTGRKVTSIRFFIKSKVEEISSPNIEPETEAIKEINEQINKFGLFVKKEIVEFWSKYGTYQVRKKKGRISQTYHIIYRSHDGSNAASNLITVCTNCHTHENHQKGNLLWKWMVEKKKTKRYKEGPFMNIFRRRVFDTYPDAHITYGSMRLHQEKKNCNSKKYIPMMPLQLQG